MTENDRAIELFEFLIEHNGIYSCAPCLLEEAKWKEILAHTIQVLRARQEREKGCEHCTGSVDGRKILLTTEHGKDVYIDGNGRLTVGDDDIQACFCPMCGRKVGDKE